MEDLKLPQPLWALQQTHSEIDTITTLVLGRVPKRYVYFANSPNLHQTCYHRLVIFMQYLQHGFSVLACEPLWPNFSYDLCMHDRHLLAPADPVQVANLPYLCGPKPLCLYTICRSCQQYANVNFVIMLIHATTTKFSQHIVSLKSTVPLTQGV